MLFILLLMNFTNTLPDLINELENKEKIKSFSVEMEYDFGVNKIFKYSFYFLENELDSTLPYLYLYDYDLNSQVLIKDYKKYEFRNDTLFLDTDKFNALDGYYSSTCQLLYPIQNPKISDVKFSNTLKIYEKFHQDKMDTNNKDYKYLIDSLYTIKDTLVIDLKYHVVKNQPYNINVKGHFNFKYDENYNLLRYYEQQIRENTNLNYDTTYKDIKFSNYNFNTPDSSLFNTDRPYKVLINMDSVRQEDKRNYEERKKTAHILHEKFPLLNKEVIDITKQKEIKVYNFWGSWCGFCYKSYPSIQKIYDEFGDKVEVIGWGAMERDTTKVTPYIKKNNINFPYVLGADSLAYKLTISSYPTTQIYKGNELFYKCSKNSDSLYYEIKSKLNELGVE